MLFIFCGSKIEAQASTAAKDILGRWFLVNSGSSTEDSLVFSKTPANIQAWGDRIEVYSDGTIVDAYSGKCGNDSSSRNIKGTWSLESNIFVSSILIYQQSKKYKISLLNREDLVLKKL